MDYFQDVAQLVHLELEVLPELVQLVLQILVAQPVLLQLALPLHRAMPSTLQDLHRALLQVQLQVLD